MAQGVVIRFKADSTEYDAKLKRSIEQLKSMEDQAKKLQGSIDRTDEGYIKFVQSLGQMETVAKSSKTALREYSEAILYLQQQYKALSEAEKSGDVGKAMANSIQQLKVRAAEAQDTIGDLNEEIKHLASDTSFTDGIGLMTRTVGSCAAAITAWTGDSKEMEVVIKDLAKIGTTVAAVESLTKAFQKQNLVLLKNPYVAAAAAVVALGVAIGKVIQKSQELSEVEKALQDVQAKGRENAAKEVTKIETLNNILHDNTRSIEERRSALAQIQSLVPDYHGALTAEGTLINDNTDAMDGYIDSLQRAATAQAAFDKMVELQKTKMEKQVELQKAQKELEKQQAAASQPVTRDQMIAQAGMGRNVYGSVTETNKTLVDAAQGEVNKIQKVIDEQDAQINALRELVKANDIESPTSTTTSKGGKTAATGVVTTEELNPLQEAKRKISELSTEALTADEARTEAIRKEIDGLQAQVEAYKQIQDYVQGIKKEESKPAQIEGPSGYSQEGISALRSEIQGGIKGMQMGSQEYMIQADRLVDLTTFENILNTAVQRGVALDPALLESAFEKIDLGLDVKPEEWQNLVDIINEQVNELNPDPIELDVKTGGIKDLKEEVKGTIDHVQGAASAFQALGNAMGQIEDPGAKVAGMIAEAIGSVAAGYGAATAQAAALGPWAWIAFAVTGLATMISTIAGIKSATAGSYASGGIVPGNSFSGDNLTANVNSGELILNRAQQASVASQLQGSAQQTVNVQGMVSGSNIILAVRNRQNEIGSDPSLMIAGY